MFSTIKHKGESIMQVKAPGSSCINAKLQDTPTASLNIVLSEW